MIESLEEVLSIDPSKLKANELKKLVSSMKKFIKSDLKKEANSMPDESELPYYAVGAHGNFSVKLKYNPETREALVVDIEEDPRGAHMSYYHAENFLMDEIKGQTKRK